MPITTLTPAVSRSSILVLSLSLFAAIAPPTLIAQETHEKETKTIEKDKPAEPAPPTPKEESSVTDHTIKIGGQSIPYKATAP